MGGCCDIAGKVGGMGGWVVGLWVGEGKKRCQWVLLLLLLLLVFLCSLRSVGLW